MHPEYRAAMSLLPLTTVRLNLNWQLDLFSPIPFRPQVGKLTNKELLASFRELQRALLIDDHKVAMWLDVGEECWRNIKTGHRELSGVQAEILKRFLSNMPTETEV